MGETYSSEINNQIYVLTLYKSFSDYKSCDKMGGSGANNGDLSKTFEWFEPSEVLKDVKSAVWDFFKFKGTKAEGPSKSKVYCSLCIEAKKDPSVAYSGGTSNLATHMKNHHPDQYSQVAKKPPNKITAYMNDRSNSKSQYKWPKSSPMWKNTTKALAKWLCKSSRPSQLVKDEGFRILLNMLCPEYEVPCPQTIINFIENMYEETKEKIKDKLSEVEFVAITTDGGTSSNAVSFVGTNVHYLDEDLNMQFHIIGVRENKEKHTAINFRRKNDELLEEFKIGEKVVKTVTDNEAKMRAAYDDSERVACLAHIFHKSVTKGCEDVVAVKKTVLKIRKISKKHNKSYALRYGVEAAQKKRNLKVRPLHQDVPTRWGSTRDSMESFLDQKLKKTKNDEEHNIEDLEEPEEIIIEEFKNSEAINEALRNLKYKNKEKVGDFILSRIDMNRIKHIHNLLSKLDVFSTTLGGAKFVTISIVLPVIKSIIKLLLPQEDDPNYIREMKEAILGDFRIRVQELLSLSFLMKTVALDPRFKNLKTVDDKSKREKVFTDLEHEMRQHLETKENSLEKNDEPIGKKRKIGLDFDESDEEDEGQTDGLRRELETYRAEPLLDKDSDPLEWWRKRKQKYPNLVRLIR